MIKIFVPIFKEIKTRIEENREIHNMVLIEKENIKKEHKKASIFRKIDFIDTISDNISDKKLNYHLKKFQEKKMKEVQEKRAERMYQYVRSRSFFALIGVVILSIVIIITIGTLSENTNPNHTSKENIIIDKNAEAMNPTSNLAIEQDSDKANESSHKENVNNQNQLSEKKDNQEHQIIQEQNEPMPTSTVAPLNQNLQEDKPIEEAVNVTIPASTKTEHMVWIPTNGGKKYHSRSGCSKMKNPQEVSVEQAQKRGYTACGKCH